jgi:hypothetical protein
MCPNTPTRGIAWCLEDRKKKEEKQKRKKELED